MIKVGKNIRESICTDYILLEIDDFLIDLDKYFDYDTKNQGIDEIQTDYLNSVDDFINPGQYLKR